MSAADTTLSLHDGTVTVLASIGLCLRVATVSGGRKRHLASVLRWLLSRGGLVT